MKSVSKQVIPEKFDVVRKKREREAEAVTDGFCSREQ